MQNMVGIALARDAHSKCNLPRIEWHVGAGWQFNWHTEIPLAEDTRLAQRSDATLRRNGDKMKRRRNKVMI